MDNRDRIVLTSNTVSVEVIIQILLKKGIVTNEELQAQFDESTSNLLNQNSVQSAGQGDTAKRN